MAMAAVMANLARIIAWWREVDWRATAAYSITGVPAAALGAKTLLVLSLITGSSLTVGTFLSKRFVVRLDAEAFGYMLDALMLFSGFAMLWNAFAS